MGMLRGFHRPFKLHFVVWKLFALTSCTDASEDVNTSFGKVLYKQRHELKTLQFVLISPEVIANFNFAA